jgi:hypothetical protein
MESFIITLVFYCLNLRNRCSYFQILSSVLLFYLLSFQYLSPLISPIVLEKASRGEL